MVKKTPEIIVDRTEERDLNNDIKNEKAIKQKFFFLSDFFFSLDNLIILLILIFVPFVLFWQTTGFELVWDDVSPNLTKNPYLNPPSFNNLLYFWKESYEKLYIPLAYTLWGSLKILGSNMPFGYHLANVILHTFNGILVFALLGQIIKNRWAATTGALLFITHPLQVESVAWVSEFRGLLAAFFCFAALYFYIKACHIKYETDHDKWLNKNFVISWMLFCCALLSKPSAVVMPLFAILIEYYLYRPHLKRIATSIWLFFIPVIIITIVTSSVQSKPATYPFWAKPLIWMDAISFYLYKLWIPFSLAASYARTPSYVLAQWWIYVIWIIPVSLGFYFWHIRKKAPWLILSLLLFITGFLPVSGLVEFSFQSWSTVADRYLYLSMFGIALGCGSAATYINQKWQWGIITIGIVFLAGWSGLVQTKIWKNSFTLWDHCIAVTPLEYRAYNHRGNEYAKQKDYNTAIFDYNKAIIINPNYAKPYNNRGKAYALKMEHKEALGDFNTAISLNPQYADAYYNRGLLYSEKNEHERALLDYSKAISINSKNPLFYNNRGIVYGLKKEFFKAISDFNTAVSINPKYADAYNNRAVTLFYMKDYKSALADVQKSQGLGKKIDPEFLKELKMKAAVE